MITKSLCEIVFYLSKIDVDFHLLILISLSFCISYFCSALGANHFVCVCVCVCGFLLSNKWRRFDNQPLQLSSCIYLSLADGRKGFKVPLDIFGEQIK